MSEQVSHGSDNPVNDSDFDAFQYGSYAKALAQTLTEVDLPFCLGIFAGWGQGKTSLMLLIQKELTAIKIPAEENAADNTEALPPFTLWFDAWKYDKEETVWRALLAQCLETLGSALEAGAQQKSTTKEKRKTITEFLTTTVEPCKQQLYRSFSRTEANGLSVNWGTVAQQLAMLGVNVGLPGASVFSALWSVFGKNKKGDGPITEKDDENIKADVKQVEKLFGAIEQKQTESYYEHIRHLEQFKETFATLVGKALPLLGRRRLVIFIDDLDRCEPRKAIEVLEAMKLFLETEDTAFVIGVDDEVVHAGLKQRYGTELAKLYNSSFNPNGHGNHQNGEGGDDSDNHRPYHFEYLEKIIQLPFTLPAISRQDIADYILPRLDKSIDENQRKQLVLLFCEACHYNPRKIKRLCNLLNLNWSIARSRFQSELGLKSEQELEQALASSHFSLILLAKLVVIQSQHRGLYYRLLNRQITLLEDLEQAFARDHNTSTDKKTKPQADDDQHEATEKPATALDESASRDLLTDKPNNIGPYLNLPWLKSLLRWESQAHISTFSALVKNDVGGSINEHLELKPRRQTVSDEARAGELVSEQDLDGAILKDLLNDNTDIIATAVDRLTQTDRLTYARYLVSFLNGAEASRAEKDWRRWVAAGDALGYLGDPRLEQRIDQRERDWVKIDKLEFYRGVRPGDPGEEINNIDGELRTLDKPFAIHRYPVTNKDWQDFLDANSSGPRPWNERYPWGLENHPVVNVSWDDVQVYLAWLNQQADDYEYRLPSEAQWERAARGPAMMVDKNGEATENRRRYPWGETFNRFCANVNETMLYSTTAVGAFPLGASYEGIMDLSGNVWERCADTYQADYYQQERVEVSEEGKYYVIRGGSFNFNRVNGSCVCRGSGHPGSRNNYVGFRVARINKT